VDVYPGTSKPLDYPRYADRLKDNGTAALADYLTFDDAEAGPPAGLPRKGMSAQEVDSLLGAAVSSSERLEGTLKLVTRSYRSSAGVVTGEFVEGVHIRYTVTSE